MSIDVVTQVKAELLAAGQNLDHACGAFKITSTAAYRLNPTADPNGWGLIHSTGNGCSTHGDHYRTDTMMLKNGTVYDCLSMSESNNGLVYPAVPHDSYNIPVWNPTGPQDPANWRAPYDPGLLTGAPPEPEPEPDQDDTDEILAQIIASADFVNAHTTAEADRVLAELKRLEEELELFAEQALKVLTIIRRRRDDEPPA